MSVKYLLTQPSLNIPNPYRSIGRARDKNVALVLQSPHAAFVSLKLLPKFSGLGIIDVDKGIVASSNNLVLVKLQAGNNMARVRSKGNMAWLNFTTGPALPNHMMATVKRFVQMKLAKARQAQLGIRYRCSCRVCRGDWPFRLVLLNFRFFWFILAM
jgi:hypothetical protein